MQKSILIIGLGGSGKSTALKSLLKIKNTSFVKDESLTLQEIEDFRKEAEANKSFCIAVFCGDISFISTSFLSNYDVIVCEYDPKFTNS